MMKTCRASVGATAGRPAWLTFEAFKAGMQCGHRVEHLQLRKGFSRLEGIAACMRIHLCYPEESQGFSFEAILCDETVLRRSLRGRPKRRCGKKGLWGGVGTPGFESVPAVMVLLRSSSSYVLHLRPQQPQNATPLDGRTC
jgi:hypothetical protein